MSEAIIKIQTSWLRLSNFPPQQLNHSWFLPFWLNHVSGASFFPPRTIQDSFLQLSAGSAPETNHNSLWEVQPGNEPLLPVLRSSTEPSHHYRAPCLSSLPPLPSDSMCVEKKSPPLSEPERTSPTSFYARRMLSKRIPLRSAPPLSVSLPPSFIHDPGQWRRRFRGAHCRRQRQQAGVYMGPRLPQPAHSQSLRLGNQGISGDSRLYFALSG